MPLFFKNQTKFQYLEHLPTGNLLAITGEDAKRFKALVKQYKGSEKIPSSETTKGFIFVLDEEFNSLKIDFDKEVEVKLNELTKAQIK